MNVDSQETAAPMHSEQAGTAGQPCKECAGLFFPKRAWAVFCGSRCRNEWHRKQALDVDGRLAEVERRLAALEKAKG